MLPDRSSRRVAIAWSAVLAGGLLAAASLWLESRPADLPADAVARVGSQIITRAQWLRAVEAVQTDRKTLLDSAARTQILQRLIDEELLYQHALDSGLARNDPGLRKTLIAGLMDAATEGGIVDEAAARAMFERDPAYFSAQPRLRVAAVELDAAATPPPEGAVRAVLLGAGAEPPLRRVDLPATALPLPQIAQRLGGSAAEALRRAPPEQLIGPLPRGGRQLYLMLLERQADSVRYEEVAEAVRSEWARREAEAALARLLADLRSSASIRIAADAR